MSAWVPMPVIYANIVFNQERQQLSFLIKDNVQKSLVNFEPKEECHVNSKESC